MRIFLTGGSGLLGNTILRQLGTGGGHEVGYLVRPGTEAEIFAGLDARSFPGGLADAEVLDQAASWADVVVHCAGMIHIGWGRLDESMQVNRDGTANLVDACLRHGTRLLHIGTVNTLAVGSRERLADEETPFDHAGGQVPCSYVVSKRAGNEVVHAGVARGLDAVLLHPAFMLGPWDWKPSSGRMMLEVGRAWKPIAPRGGCSVCDSRDVADAIIAAAERPMPSGREYVLAGENLTYYQLWSRMAARFGKRKPIMPAGPAQRIIGSLWGDGMTRLTGVEGDLNSAGIRMTTQFHYYDSSRARDELGYRNRPLDQTLDDSARWIREHFM